MHPEGTFIPNRFPLLLDWIGVKRRFLYTNDFFHAVKDPLALPHSPTDHANRFSHMSTRTQ